MVQWIAILVSLVCLSGSTFSRSWVGYDDANYESWKADPGDKDLGSKPGYHSGPASSESYEDYSESGNDGHFNNKGYHNERDGYVLGYDPKHNHYGFGHQYHSHGYTNNWGPHGHHSQTGSLEQPNQYGHGYQEETSALPDHQWGSHGHPTSNGPSRGLSQNNLITPQRPISDGDRIVFPDFNTQAPTTRFPLPTADTARPTTTDRTLLDRVICIRACPATSEYNPVCGTNNVTYNNPGALQCARNCGLNMEVARQGPCQRVVLQIPQLTRTPTTARASPDTSTQTPTVIPTVNPTRFTSIDVNPPPNRPDSNLIPLDILQFVFGNASLTSSNTEDSEFDIDERMNLGVGD